MRRVQANKKKTLSTQKQRHGWAGGMQNLSKSFKINGNNNSSQRRTEHRAERRENKNKKRNQKQNHADHEKTKITKQTKQFHLHWKIFKIMD